MDPKLYEAVLTGDVASLQQLVRSDITVLRQVTAHEDNILHVAAKYNRKQMAEEIVRAQRSVSLVCQKNVKGDTALHVAARLGSLGTAQVLINCARGINGEIEANERLVRMVNMKNETALHDAVRNGHLKIAELLIKEDPELTRSRNDVGESPLFIAVDKKHVDIAKHILNVAPSCSFKGRNNMNALHAAVVRSQDEVITLSSYLLKLQSPMNYMTNMSFKHHLKFSYSFGPSTIFQAAISYAIYAEFLKFLTEKIGQSALSETDDYGWAPLHYAVHFGAMDTVKLFLRCDSSIANVSDNEGMYATHIAAREGEVDILEMLAYLSPDIWDLQDNKGQTVLHLAVASGKLDSVKLILDTPLSHDGLINQQDNEGNTALHLATIQRHQHKIFELMVKDSRVDKTVTNMQGLTVIDILLFNKELGFFEKNWITLKAASKGGLESLEHTINKNGRKTNSIETGISEQQQPHANRINAGPPGVKKPSYDKLHNIASINLLVTTLIATVSFAAGFTMPGGYKSDNGPEDGTAILSGKTAFRVFVISNALAFCFSTTSMFLHYYKSFVEKLDVLSFYTYMTTLLTSYGISAMVIAFVSGTYATLSDSPGLAKAVLSIGCSFFGLQLIVYLK